MLAAARADAKRAWAPACCCCVAADTLPAAVSERICAVIRAVPALTRAAKPGIVLKAIHAATADATNAGCASITSAIVDNTGSIPESTADVADTAVRNICQPDTPSAADTCANSAIMRPTIGAKPASSPPSSRNVPSA